MHLDSTTAAAVATVATTNPGIGLIVLVLIVGVIYLLSLLLRNTRITEAIAAKVEHNEESAQILREIRKDQVESNKERKEQGVRITAIEGRLDIVEKDVASVMRVLAASQPHD